MKTLLIGISGKARVGKDTVASRLQYSLEKFTNQPFYKAAFANELKDRLAQDFNLTHEQVHGNEKEVLDKRYPKGDSFWTPREMMQEYGQFMRSIENDFWVRNLLDKVDKDDYNNYIITDLRHINEVQSVLDRGGIHIKVVRDETDKINGEDHISETALDNTDLHTHYTIHNNVLLDELHVMVDKLAESIIHGGTKWQKVK